MTALSRLMLTLGLVLVAVPAHAGDPRDGVVRRLSVGAAAFTAGDIAAATAEWSQAISQARQIGALDLLASGLVRRGEAQRVIGHLIDADADLREAVTTAQQSGDRALIAAADGALG